MKSIDEKSAREAWAGARDKITLSGDRVLLRVSKHETEKRTKGGIALPDTYDKRVDAARATVVAYGKGFYTHMGEFVTLEELVPGIFQGAAVAFTRAGPSEQSLQIDGEDYLVVRSAEIVGVLHGE